MLTAEECAVVKDLGDVLNELYVQRDEAVSEGDLDRVHELQMEIDDVKAERQKIISVAHA
jgi:hypothetical protein